MATDPRGAQPYRPADPQAGGVADRRGPTSGADPQGPAGSPQDRPARPSAGNPPLALDGYCTVTLSEKEQWVRGNPRFGVIHAGRTYLFVGQTEARRFYDTPERFAPANGGNDVVAMAERSQTVAGRREFGGFYEGRVYLFASEDSYQKFTQDPGRYVGAAVNPSAATVQRGDATPPSGPSAGSPDWSNPRGASPGLPPDGQMPPSGGYEGAIRSQPPAGRF
jgi:protein disulfide-isomerase